jgi:hypothetical protein
LANGGLPSNRAGDVFHLRNANEVAQMPEFRRTLASIGLTDTEARNNVFLNLGYVDESVRIVRFERSELEQFEALSIEFAPIKRVKDVTGPPAAAVQANIIWNLEVKSCH